MKLTTKQLLRRRKLTGEQVGKALIANLVYNFKLMKERKPPEQIVSVDDLRKLKAKLPNDKERAIYETYGAINDSILETFNRVTIKEQLFYNGFYKNYLTLARVSDAERAEIIVNNTPLVVTREEYRRIRGRTKETLQSIDLTYQQLFFIMLEYYRNNPDKACKCTAKALEATKAEPATNERLLANYNKAHSLGYSSLPDGSRSDQMTKEAFTDRAEELFVSFYSQHLGRETAAQEALLYHLNEGKKKGLTLLAEGPEAIKQEASKRGIDLSELTNEALIENLSLTLKREAKAEIRNKLERVIYPEGSVTGVWHYIEEPPVGLTKYQLLETSLSYYKGDWNPEENPKDFFKEFTKDYQELYQAVRSEIELIVPQARRIKSSQADKHIATQGELAELRIEPFLTLTEPTEENIIRGFKVIESFKPVYQQREIYSLAILDNPPPYNLDEKGFYKPFLTNPFDGLLTLKSISDSPDLQEAIKSDVQFAIEPAIRSILAYNTLIDILTYTYSLEDTEALKIDFETLIKPKTDQFNELLYHLLLNAYGKAKAQKREILRRVFPPLRVDHLYPQEANIAFVKYKLMVAGFTPESKEVLSRLDVLMNYLLEEGAK